MVFIVEELHILQFFLFILLFVTNKRHLSTASQQSLRAICYANPPESLRYSFSP